MAFRWNGKPGSVKAWLLLPVILYVAVAFYWHCVGINPAGGDEPYYLLVAESIVRDGDFDLENNLAEHPEIPAEPQCLHSPRGWYTVHNIGLPLLIAVPWALGGVLGAKLALCLLMGLAPLVMFRSIERTIRSPRWSLLITLTLSLGMPLLDGANQLYPDLPSALLLFFAGDYVMEGAGRRRSSLARFVAFVVAVAFLPWLHIKQALPALTLLVGHLAGCRSEGRARKLATVATLAGSLVALAWYNLHAFDCLTGPYDRDGLVFDFPRNAMIFLGLHWDQAHGMFLQQPFLLLGLIGLGPMWRSNRGGLTYLALLGATALLPNCMHPNWYGGQSFVGRFGWSSVLLWSVPVAHAARWLCQRRPTALMMTCAVCGALQVASASYWLTSGGRLIAGFCQIDTPLWAYNGLYPLVRNQLPFWHPSDLQWRHAPNYSFLLFGAALIATGWNWLRHRRAMLAKIWIPVTAACVTIQSLPKADRSELIQVGPTQMMGAVGQVRRNVRVAAEPLDPAGVIAWVPQLCLAEGDYLVRVEYAAQGIQLPKVGSLCVVFGTAAPEFTALGPTGAEGREMRATVHVNRRYARRCAAVGLIYDGRGILTVEQLSIERLRR
jgi:hypothetical protein